MLDKKSPVKIMDSTMLEVRRLIRADKHKTCRNMNGGIINGTSYIIVAWSIFFYFAFSALRLRDISRAIMQDVQSGNVEVLFNKPISYLGYRIWCKSI